MATSQDQKIVLVSGANGYIAANIVVQLLKKGYTVRGTSRSAGAKARLLSDAFKGFESQYQHYEVKDITVAGAFDEAVKGVHHVIHTASPVDFTLTSVDAFAVPAVKGNLSILNSARDAAGPQLESFVVTSSIAAMFHDFACHSGFDRHAISEFQADPSHRADRWKQPVDHAYIENDWNTSGEGVARADFSAPVAYGASKALAEKAMWDWVEAKKPSFACAAINPGVVTGPPVTWPDTPAKLNTTLLPVWNIYAGQAKTMPPQIGGATFIDVRDVAALHVWAALHPSHSNGQRYLATNGKAPPQAAADLLRRKLPDRDIIVGEPGKGYVETSYWFPDGEATAVATKAYKAMGVERFIDYEKSIMDTIEAFEKKWPGKAQESS